MSVRESSLREEIEERRAVGTFVKLPALESVDIAAAQLDFVVVDLEHSQLSEAEARRLVRHAGVLGFPAVVRIPELDRGLVNRLLEAGAAGIQLSTVTRAAQVGGLNLAMRYPPEGARSISLAHPAAGYGRRPLREYVPESPAPLAVVQIETMETEDPLDEILEEAPDVVFLGVTDLLVDAGLDEEKARARADEIAAAASRAGAVLGGFGTDERYRYSVVSSDVALLQEAIAGVR
jgi:4-hydroxy-2-oxoheptanedioate aldolase